ncbi:MAG TPA: trypsin-like peptidase domain-containing protein [Spirochaetia bacterium]|nr:trypsin-like peptidase domain-containing protein [Spirochaetia bacterium]
MQRNRRLAHRYGATLFFVLAIILPGSEAFAQADLKEYVALIRTNFHPDTVATFESLATHFSQQGQKQLADFFAAYAKAGGFGTGWVYVAADGENFIITNRHVVSEAATVNIGFEQLDGSYKTYSDAPIVYVDDFMDIAVVQFPGRERVFSRGFPINTAFMPDGTQLFSAGFPAFGGEPLWQFSTGIVTNSRARPVGFQGYEYLIQHSAQIDKGNSGGPLMVRDPRSVTGYDVIGVNTWKATQRENTNFSIPANMLLSVIERARKAIAVHASGPSMSAALDQTCKVLAAELRSSNPDLAKIHQFISYAQVGRRGWEAFQTIISTVDDPKTWEKQFFEDPIETMRTSLYYLFWVALGKREGGDAVEYSGVNVADQGKIGVADDIRTEYRVGDSSTEISWTWEYGQWRVVDFELPALATARSDAAGQSTGEAAAGQSQTFAATPFSIVRLGLAFTAGSSNGHGSAYNQPLFPSAGSSSADKSVFAWSAGVSAETNITRSFWLQAQLNVAAKGRYYEWNYPVDADPTNNIWVSENILYLQIPVMAEIFVLVDKGLSFTAALGPALNIAIAPGGVYWDWNDNQFDLASTWYSGNYWKPITLSAVGELGFYFGLGGSALGIVGRVDYDLTNSFDYGSSGTSHFVTVSGGLRLVFPIYTASGTK